MSQRSREGDKERTTKIKNTSACLCAKSCEYVVAEVDRQDLARKTVSKETRCLAHASRLTLRCLYTSKLHNSRAGNTGEFSKSDRWKSHGSPSPLSLTTSLRRMCASVCPRKKENRRPANPQTTTLSADRPRGDSCLQSRRDTVALKRVRPLAIFSQMLLPLIFEKAGRFSSDRYRRKGVLRFRESSPNRPNSTKRDGFCGMQQNFPGSCMRRTVLMECLCSVVLWRPALQNTFAVT
ncbi:hypothetical protein TGVEG_270130 [Toxoplasma gondii VEG]|uniref:Uncharacterized protein n=1 Tax=Toxoplasma gondii (strain ATCC 50861 / VEG) TaxID=432359 RepID=V4ZMJ7_TOXGV|nr:hypothetical protein TGVEG_270130 [Toxoplasma gondii VEG]